MIDIVELSHKYTTGDNQIVAVNNVNLVIQKGEFVAIVGTSGAGKSTLLHLMGGLQVPNSGEIKINGQDFSKLSEERRAKYRNENIGFIFQNFYLQKHLTALENVILPLKIRREKYAARQQKATKVLEDLGLKDRLHHLPGELSGGEQQRVAIARAIVGDPLILLADEPTGNLDSQTSQEIVKILTDLNNHNNLTIVMVTHSTEIARTAHRVMHVKDGECFEEE